MVRSRFFNRRKRQPIVATVSVPAFPKITPRNCGCSCGAASPRRRRPNETCRFTQYTTHLNAVRPWGDRSGGFDRTTGWDKEVRLSSGFSTGSWFHVLAWITPGSEIGLSLNGGDATETEALSTGQSAWTGDGELYLGHEPPPSSSSSESQSSEPPSSSEEEFQAVLTEAPLPGFDGAIDEMAFFNENVTEPERTALYDGGSGLFYNGSTWGPCGA